MWVSVSVYWSPKTHPKTSKNFPMAIVWISVLFALLIWNKNVNMQYCKINTSLRLLLLFQLSISFITFFYFARKLRHRDIRERVLSSGVYFPHQDPETPNIGERRVRICSNQKTTYLSLKYDSMLFICKCFICGFN